MTHRNVCSGKPGLSVQAGHGEKVCVCCSNTKGEWPKQHYQPLYSMATPSGNGVASTSLARQES